MALPEVTESTFGDIVLDAGRPMIVFFQEEGSEPCKLMLAILDDFVVELPNYVGLVTFTIDQSPEMAERYGIYRVPAVVLYQRGREESRTVGASSKEHLRRWLRRSL